METVYYAIGDVHGELKRLRELHRDIARFHKEHHAGLKQVLVHLGDYVDRGPDSVGVISMLMALSKQENIVCLKGNHEVMMLDALVESRNMDWWLSHGGAETLKSYREKGQTYPPKSHLDWLDALQTRLHMCDRKLVFVHAAINTLTFPEPDERQHLWGRSSDFFESLTWSNPALEGYTIIHGHTPTDDYEPDVSDDRRRINVDTGAVYGGALTAVALAPDRPPAFLSV